MGAEIHLIRKKTNQQTKRSARNVSHRLKEEFSHWLPLLSADGLVDCMDPDCCLQSSCQNQPYCHGLPDPQDVISQSLQSPPQQAAKSFYDRISFLIGSDSTHVLPGESPFNKRLMRFVFSLHRCVVLLSAVTCTFYEMLMTESEESAFSFNALFPLSANSSPNFAFQAFLTQFTYFVNFSIRAITGHPIKESINLHLTS